MMRSKIWILSAILFAASMFAAPSAFAQSTCQYLVYNAQLTTAQWQACFAGKQDALAGNPLLTTGGVMTGPLITAAPTTTAAGLNLPQGSAPTSPNNGDIWTTSGGLFVQINGSTVGPFVNASVTSVGLSLPGIFTVTGSPVTGSGILTGTLTTQSANTIFAGPSSGSAAAPTFRAMVGADLPNPGASTLGGIRSLALTTHQWINSISTSGVPAASQPAFSDISGTLGVTQGGTGAATFTANLPLIGNGTGTVGQGTKSGSTTLFATASGTLTNGHCVSIDASGNFIDAGGACTTGGAGGTVSSGTANQLTWYQSSGTTVVGLATANNGVLITSGAGVPSIGSTLPAAVQSNITALGTIGTGVWQGTLVGATFGGTGVNNGSSTITLGGSLTFSGAFTTAITVTGATTVTLPTSGTLVNSAVATLASLTSVGTIGTGTWQGTVIGATYGGTGVNNGSNTITLAAALTTTGAGAPTLAFPGTARVFTFPNAAGTLAELGLAQTWPGAQTFNTNNLILAGSTSGATTLNAAAIAGSTVISFPAVTDTVAVLGTADQILSGGANYTSFSIGSIASGTTTIDCGKNPAQYLTNSGAFTLAAPSSDGSCIVLVTNNTTAGTISFSGFSVGTSTGDAINTTNGNKFTVSIWRANGTAGYRIAAMQ